MRRKSIWSKVFVLCLAVIMVFSMAACGGDEPAAPPAADNPATPPASGDIPVGDPIKIGFVAPFSGPMSNFVVGIEHAWDLASAEINKDGGVVIDGVRHPVEVIWGDTETNTTKASEVATKLVTEEKVNILVGEWTPETTSPVSVVGERYKVPTLLANGPDTSWLEQGPYEWCWGLFFNYSYFIDEYFNGFDTIDTNKRIGMILDTSVDGVGEANFIKEKAPERGYEVFDPGLIPPDTNDFTSVITQIMNADCDIVVSSMLTPQLATIWSQMQQLGYEPKVAVLAKGGHFSEDVKTFGPNNVNFCIETQWSPEFPFTSSLLGMTAAELSEDFEATIGDPPDLGLGWDYTIFDVIADVLSRTESLDPEDINAAFAATDLNCTYGHITFADNHVGYCPIVFGQWIDDGEGGYDKILNAAGHVPEITDDLLSPVVPIPWDKIK